MKKANEDGAAIVDVDGSYLYRKYKSLADAGKNVSLPTTPPPPPISGWITMSNENYQALSSTIPPVTHGKFYFGVASRKIQYYTYAFSNNGWFNRFRNVRGYCTNMYIQ